MKRRQASENIVLRKKVVNCNLRKDYDATRQTQIRELHQDKDIDKSKPFQVIAIVKCTGNIHQ